MEGHPASSAFSTAGCQTSREKMLRNIGPSDDDARSTDVDVRSSQPRCFAPPEASVGANQHQGSVALRHRLDQSLDLGLGQEPWWGLSQERCQWLYRP